ncbi:hypothetical protein N7532_005064 [Penicillium argentinense]|uniref:Uncharacterized protein n=1 Tax=Penicillium argentinense TaxID=1131581 RepID=A0A9W9FD83_9EURO|nr:uncharacterized protein N7532_005064 [Penicillium argentinense]KAJ5098063.1 hypothetical protein N7532_005064 [Penicillium argentinense]
MAMESGSELKGHSPQPPSSLLNLDSATDSFTPTPEPSHPPELSFSMDISSTAAPLPNPNFFSNMDESSASVAPPILDSDSSMEDTPSESSGSLSNSNLPPEFPSSMDFFAATVPLPDLEFEFTTATVNLPSISSISSQESREETPYITAPHLRLSATTFEESSAYSSLDSPEDLRNSMDRARAGLYCHHETIQRYWGPPSNLPLHCDNCGEATRFLYECTADTANFSAYKSEIPERNILILPEWEQKAIAENQYTGEQVEKLLDQKMKVLTLAAEFRMKVPDTDKAMPAGQGIKNDINTPLRQINRDIMLKAAKAGDYSQTEPCRMLWCANCRPGSSENAWGGIDQVVEEPYKEPPAIPHNLYRPLTDASVLRNMHKDPTHWRHFKGFQQWWKDNRYPAGNDLTPVLDWVEIHGLPSAALGAIGWWVWWQQMPADEYELYLDWLEVLNGRQFEWHACQTSDPSFVFFNEDLIYEKYLPAEITPVPLSTHPIWEEADDAYGEPIAIPDYEYEMSDRYAARNPPRLRGVAGEYYIRQTQFLVRQLPRPPPQAKKHPIWGDSDS